MKLFINTGGKGTRLYPLTKTVPKPMVPILGKPVLHYIVEWAEKNGIKEIVMMNGYKSDQIIDYFKDGSSFNVSISHSNEPYPLGSGGPIKLASNHVDGTFCYMNGDSICNIDLKKVLDFHKSEKADMTIVLTEKEPGYYGDFLKIDENKSVLEFISKDEKREDSGNLAHAGMCIFEPKVLELMDQEVFNLEPYVFPKALNAGYNVKGYVTAELFEDMGTPERMEKVTKMLKERK